MSEEWRKQKGVGTKIDWSPASLARGNEGVAGLVKRTPGAIGYVEFGMAKRTRLPMAWLENKAGKFVQPTGKPSQAALEQGKLPANLRAFYPDPEGEDSYPIVTYTWILINQEYTNPRTADAIKRFLHWCLSDGQQFNEGLGFIRLPAAVVSSGLDAVGQVK
jgi:phosphate transport system substrate-binding protein